MNIDTLVKELQDIKKCNGNIEIFGGRHPGEKGSELTKEDIFVCEDIEKGKYIMMFYW